MTRPWTLIVLARRETVRQRIAAQLYAARIAVIAAQLRAMRGTYPRGWAS